MGAGGARGATPPEGERNLAEGGCFASIYRYSIIYCGEVINHDVIYYYWSLINADISGIMDIDTVL